MNQITIIGGGLAGLSLGIALRHRNVPVTIHEAGSYPRHRVCGEFISGVSPETLANLGIAEIFGDARQLRTTAWHLSGEPIMTRDLPEAATGISRYALDRKLAKHFIAVGGDLRIGSRRRDNDESGTVWACGRQAVRDSPWLGLKVHVYHLEQSADLEMHLGAAGYAGIATVENGAANLCGLFRREPSIEEKGPALLLAYLERNGLSTLADRLRSAKLDDDSFLGVSAFRLGPQENRPDRCVIGDAQSMIAPFTGNGMSMAFQSAALAIDPLARYATGAARWSAVAESIRVDLRNQFRRRLSVSKVLHPFLFSGSGRRLLGFAGSHGLIPFNLLYRSLR